MTATLSRIAVAVCAALTAAPAMSAGPDDPAPSPSGAKMPAVKLEQISGSPAKRVILSPKAKERLGIEMGAIGEAVVPNMQVVSGVVVAPAQAAASASAEAPQFSGFTRTARTPGGGEPSKEAAQADAWVRVALSPGELARVAKDKPARVVAMNGEARKPVAASLASLDPVEDMRRSMLTVYYAVQEKEHGLAPGQRLRVEVPLAGAGDVKQKIAPYSAVYYDAKGTAWVYVNTAPNTFERHKVAVQRVVGGTAVLSDGPAVGTQVVTVGAAMLYGTEVFGK